MRRLFRVSRSSYQVRAYNIRHNRYDVSEFLEAYRGLLQRADDGLERVHPDRGGG
jgi:hypothetical protein